MKRCIFHYPGPISDDPKAGSALRPNRMLQALRDIGYEVDCVTGYSAERKNRINAVKNRIKNGEHYDFVYSESVNDPTAMSDSDHIPRHPFMDFSFFRFCRKHQIPVAMFYRDVYWKFHEIFKSAASTIKRMILIPMFSYDVLQYSSCLDLLYLPTKRMQNYVMQGLPSAELPPGGDLRPGSLAVKQSRIPMADGKLEVFYVGSLSALYDNRKLFQAVQETEGVNLTVCTHEKQWQTCKADYAPYLCDRIKIVHKSGDQLRECYEKADVAAYCLDHNEYLDMAMPIKFFEAISYGTPILATSIYSISQVIQRDQIGWVCETSVSGIKQKLEYLKAHPEDITAKTENTIAAAYQNTWECRAQQVADELTKIK